MRNRSFFFVPAHKENYIIKSFELDCDRLIFDLEDSVPHNLKSQALAAVLSCKFTTPKRHIVRINKNGTRYDSHEVQVLKANFDLLLPKAEKPIEILQVLSEIADTPSCRIWLLVETVMGFWNLRELLDTNISVLEGLVFGGEDYLASLDGAHISGDRQFIHARMSLVHAARANNLVSVDTPQLSFNNSTFLMEQYSDSRGLGFDGALLIHPNQIDIANLAYGCTPREVAEANEIVLAHEEAIVKGHAIAEFKGKIVGPPMLERAKNTLRRLGVK